MPELLPELMELLQSADTGVSTKALLITAKIMRQMDRAAVGPVALQLAEKLVPLFDEASSQVRELSIGHFKELMETVQGKARKEMCKKVRRCLLPLFFHVHDETQSVAKASWEALSAAAVFLRWAQLRDVTRSQQSWRIGECLLARGRSHVGQYVQQSLPYLEDSQASLREAAVRFLGLAGLHLKSTAEEKVLQICSALQPLENDIQPSLRSLATQTGLLLRAPSKRSASRGNWSALCCCLRRARES